MLSRGLGKEAGNEPPSWSWNCPAVKGPWRKGGEGRYQQLQVVKGRPGKQRHSFMVTESHP